MTIFEKAVDQIAPHLRDGALVALRSTVYPGTTGYVAQHLAERGCRVDVAFCPERIAEGHALEELHTLPQIIGADDDRAAERATELFGTLAEQDHPDDDQGSRAGQAVHQHVALHEVRGRQPVLHDRRPGRRRLHERPARDPRGLPARRRPAGPRASPPARACSRTRCSWPPSPPTTSRSARPRCRSTRACRRTSSRRSSAATAALTRQDRRHPRHGVQGRVGRPARVAQLQAAQAPVVGRRARRVHRSVRRRTTAS